MTGGDWGIERGFSLLPWDGKSQHRAGVEATEGVEELTDCWRRLSVKTWDTCFHRVHRRDVSRRRCSSRPPRELLRDCVWPGLCAQPNWIMLLTWWEIKVLDGSQRENLCPTTPPPPPPPCSNLHVLQPTALRPFAPSLHTSSKAALGIFCRPSF